MKRQRAEYRGRRGEAIAAWWLRLHGWRILAMRVKTTANLGAYLSTIAPGIPTTLYLGVARDPATTSVQAHAWVRCGSYYVTGGEDRERYAVVSTFAEELRR